MRFSVRPFFTLLSRTISHKLYLYPVYTLVAECGHFHFDLLCNGTLEQRVCWVKDLISSQILNCSEISQEALAPPPPPLPSSSSSSVLLFRLLSLRLSFLSAGTQTGGVQRGKWRKKNKLEGQKGGGRGGGLAGWSLSTSWKLPPLF